MANSNDGILIALKNQNYVDQYFLLCRYLLRVLGGEDVNDGQELSSVFVLSKSNNDEAPFVKDVINSVIRLKSCSKYKELVDELQKQLKV